MAQSPNETEVLGPFRASNSGATADNPAPRSIAENFNQRRHRGRAGVNFNDGRNREGYFMHYLFMTVLVHYATFFKMPVRRFIEHIVLLKAITMLLLLIYVHNTFVKEPGKCLDHVKDIWPRNGVLKVQVEANTFHPSYQLFFAKVNSGSWATSFEATPYQVTYKYSMKLTEDGLLYSFKIQPVTPYNQLRAAREIFGLGALERCPVFNLTRLVQKQGVRDILMKRFAEITPDVYIAHLQSEQDVAHGVSNDLFVSDHEEENKIQQMRERSGFNFELQPVRGYYAIEYSPEFGYLRLPSSVRYKLGIPVLVVTLDPIRDACFGKGLKHWLSDKFFGYDDIVMSSIKRLAERRGNLKGGYMRNLVTGEHYKFITLWTSHLSFIFVFAVMLVFTMVVTMLLRYSYRQILIFMIDLLNNAGDAGSPMFPAAPMLTVILALVGMEEIMAEFFHDSSLAFYVILTVWFADQFDAICMHTDVGRRHWVRFFYLYHFAFYAYHYRFNGQFSDLALFTSLLFIEHSTFYFIHHYEIPFIYQRIQQEQVLVENSSRAPFVHEESYPHQNAQNENSPYNDSRIALSHGSYSSLLPGEPSSVAGGSELNVSNRNNAGENTLVTDDTVLQQHCSETPMAQDVSSSSKSSTDNATLSR